MMVSSSRRSTSSKPWASTSRRARASRATAAVIAPAARTWAKSRTRRSRRLATRGVPRLRRGDLRRARRRRSGTPRMRAERVTIVLEVGLGVEVEAVDDPEAAAQRRGQQARARGGADQREGLERDLHRARAGTAADHEVEAVVLERGVEDLLDLGVEAVDLVDEEDLAVLERGEQRGEVAGPLDDRPGGGLDRDARARRRSRGRGSSCRRPGGPKSRTWSRASPRRARRLDRDPQVGDHLRLADVLVEPAGAEGDLEAEVVVDGSAGDEAVVHDGA